MIKYFVFPFYFLLSMPITQAEKITLLCAEESKTLDPQFAEKLVIDLEANTIESNMIVPGSLNIISQTPQYITALDIFEDAAGGAVFVLDRISGIYVWSRASPSRTLITDEYSLSTSSYKAKCTSTKPLL